MGDGPCHRVIAIYAKAWYSNYSAYLPEHLKKWGRASLFKPSNLKTNYLSGNYSHLEC